MSRKSKFMLILGFLIIFLLFIYAEKNGKENKGTTQIFEIQNTKEVYNYPDSKIATIEKHYMIINPPKDVHELKTLVEKFHKENPIDNEIKVGNKTKYFELYFYRESKKLPRDWQPDEEYMSTDRIEHHRDDCIATISYSDSSPLKYYSTMKKSRNRDDYGAFIEGLDYEDDRIVNQRGKDGEYK